MRRLGRRAVKAEPAPVAPALGAEKRKPLVKVVVIDDEVDVRELLALALGRGGFHVAGTAGSGNDALEVVRRFQPDIILLDLHMPDIGGLELFPLLREETPDSKIVVFSAISAAHMVDACLDVGAHGFIVKGVSTASITKHLWRVADSGREKLVRPYPLNYDYADAE